jgi:hypothetical protein
MQLLPIMSVGMTREKVRSWSFRPQRERSLSLLHCYTAAGDQGGGKSKSAEGRERELRKFSARRRRASTRFHFAKIERVETRSP